MSKAKKCQVNFCKEPAIRQYDTNGKGKMMWLCRYHLNRIK